MDLEIRQLGKYDVDSIWKINEDGLPGTGKVSLEEIEALLGFSSLAVGAYHGEEISRFCHLPTSKNSVWQLELCLVQQALQ